ncbi:MAG: signal recognition particle protein [Acidobacteria bacterium]|nr:signal recognition particle protein [Acidobacteriota bacterium]NIM62072.1 signal recognition particle protein [Acidobacteriota bacterium]NIO59721.1 signal recognition particle protein [Acidobacteriota bacterium]NIQ30810.1 signal recognition particle protein [Acidobacteriota bacterium]NIQ85872.1 signal recognition particle protein [Acidobacteriota bacterium]
MFDSLSERLQGAFKKLTGQARISDAVLKDTLREVRMALLEADVHLGVVKELTGAVREKAAGEEVLKSLAPGQQVIKIVREELERLLGQDDAGDLDLAGKPPSVILLVGLQGSGKTTTTAKLGAWLKKNGRYPYLVPADVYRPAAIEQLIKVGTQAGLKVYEHDGSQAPLEIAKAGILAARRSGFDTVLIDTAGRLHIDDALMDELRGLKAGLEPREILFVADSMTGQDAVRSAGEFHRALEITGVVLTKLDGDARGGAALSIRHVTGVPIKFVGLGEKIAELEPFHPDRMVGRILGMGDVLTLIEKAEEAVDEKQAEELEKKIRKNEFTLEDFRDQLKMLKKMGPLSSVVSMLPGMSHVKESDLDPKAIVRVVAIIDSMTPRERRYPQILNASRKRRIARGSGRTAPEINRLLKQFAQMKRMMKSMQSGAKKGKKGRFPFPLPGR